MSALFAVGVPAIASAAVTHSVSASQNGIQLTLYGAEAGQTCGARYLQGDQIVAEDQFSILGGSFAVAPSGYLPAGQYVVESWCDTGEAWTDEVVVTGTPPADNTNDPSAPDSELGLDYAQTGIEAGLDRWRRTEGALADSFRANGTTFSNVPGIVNRAQPGYQQATQLESRLNRVSGGVAGANAALGIADAIEGVQTGDYGQALDGALGVAGATPGPAGWIAQGGSLAVNTFTPVTTENQEAQVNHMIQCRMLQNGGDEQEAASWVADRYAGFWGPKNMAEDRVKTWSGTC